MATEGDEVSGDDDATKDHEVTEDDDATHVIFSLTVHSESPVAVLERFRHPRSRRDGWSQYDIAHMDFTEEDAYVRADRLDREVSAALDRLDESGVDAALFERDEMQVTAHFSFDAGAETIGAALVRRLARVNATIWIDAW